MKKTKNAIIILCVLASVMLCGAANAGKESLPGILSLLLKPRSSALQTHGFFVDSVVQNVSYKTSSGLAGRTNEKGVYQFKPGDTIEFFIGNKKLGQTTASELITVFDFENHSQVALLLQSLDKDDNPANGIEISEADYNKISNAPFSIAEIDGTSSAFNDKFIATFGHPLDKSEAEGNEHALQAFKAQLLSSYDPLLLKSLYETFEFKGEFGANYEGTQIFGQNPNAYLKSKASRLRLYSFMRFAREFMRTEYMMHNESYVNGQVTQQFAQERAFKFLDLVTQATGVVGLSKATIDDINKLRELKALASLGGTAGAMAPNQLSLIEHGFKTEAKGAYADIVLQRWGKDLLLRQFSSEEPVGRIIKDCFPMPTAPVSFADKLQCIERVSGEFAVSLMGIVNASTDLMKVRDRDAVMVAMQYLQLYYMFDGKSGMLGTVLGSLAQELGSNTSFALYNEETDLESALDHIAQKQFNVPTLIGAGAFYDFSLASDLINKYKATVKELAEFYEDELNTDLLVALEPDHLKVQVELRPYGINPLENQHVVCLTLSNLYGPLKNVTGNLDFSVDGQPFQTKSLSYDLFNNHSESQRSCSQPFTWALDQTMLNRSVLTVHYDFDYMISFRNQPWTQQGEKYFELSKKSVLDDLAIPIIEVAFSPSRFVLPGTTVTLDTSSTISAVENDSFTFNWEYLADAGSPAITIPPRAPDAPLTFTAPSLPAGQEFMLLRFKVTATSNSSGKQSEENVAIVVKAAPPPAGTVTSAGQVWMDRNLGASQVATSSTDSAAYGDLYQWGRGADGHQLRTSPTTSTTSSTDVPGHDKFITTEPAPPYDWRVPQNNSLWQGVSGTNNPCPAGFRLPTDTELDTERGSWASNDSAGAYTSPLKLVVAGYRGYIDGTLSFAGSSGDYGSSTVSGSSARFLGVSSGDAGVYNCDRAYGLSIRCIQD